ncbi:hypothetical protein EVA_21940 [gut metagenome]|uniref:Uncharacterized protein n=1 Tax=gut metagenome TaxID=749906 RepID=J9F4W8_9ZZZZ
MFNFQGPVRSELCSLRASLLYFIRFLLSRTFLKFFKARFFEQPLYCIRSGSCCQELFSDFFRPPLESAAPFFGCLDIIPFPYAKVNTFLHIISFFKSFSCTSKPSLLV